MSVYLSAYRLILLFLIISIALAGSSLAAEQYKSREILILHSYHPGFPWTDETMKGMQEILDDSDAPINFHVEYLDTKRQPDPEYFSHVLDAILHYKLDKQFFDLVLVSDNEALNFVIEHKNNLFPHTPIVFCGVEQNLPDLYAEGAIITGVIENPEYQDLLETIVTLQPETHEVIVIGSHRDLTGRLESQMFTNAAFSYSGKLKFSYWSDLPAEELALKLRTLKKGQVVFINGQIVETSGKLLSFPAKNKLLTQNSPVALYSSCDLCLGQGIVGGSLVSPRKQGRLAATLALEILDGKILEKGYLLIPDKPEPVFDYLQLKKFHISESLLPRIHSLINSPLRYSKLPPRMMWTLLLVFAGALAIILFLINNILQRLKAEAFLRKNKQLYKRLNQQFQIILDGIPDGLTLISREMKVIWSNKGAGTRFFNKRFGSVPGEYCCEMLYNRTEICENCPATLAFESGIAQESAITTPDKRILEVKAFPIRDEAGDVFNVIMLASDITEKSRLQEEAIRNSRLASLGELAAGVAHEINNPNALILLNAELVRKSCAAAAPILQEHFQRSGDFPLGALSYSEMRHELPHLFTEMLESACRIKTIVHDLKDFVSSDSAAIDEIIDLNEIVKAAVRLVGNTIKNSTHNFSTSYGTTIYCVQGNFQRLEQVVINLIMNSCQALPNKESGVQISTFYDVDKNQNCILVRDEGTGIKPDDLLSITNPFFTTKRDKGGTGLGLSVSARIVQDHGGTLEFFSLPGEGTTATLALPVFKEVSI